MQGKVDAKAEIEKLEKKSTLAESNKEKLQKTMGQANYETAVREDVRMANAEKVRPQDTKLPHTSRSNC